MIWCRYQCPECDKQFAHEGPPRFCPKCGYDVQAEELPEIISSPSISGGVAKNVDGIFKADQEGAEFRARIADDPTLKITDQRDNLRIGDTTAMPPPPTAPATILAPVSASQGLHYSAGTAQGPYANAGMRAAMALKSAHGMKGLPTSELPGLETQQPGYRRRV